MKLSKPKIALSLVAGLFLVVAAIALYFYSQGSRAHYVPPVAETLSAEAQVLSDLTTTMKAVEAYYSRNLKYPDMLEDLRPDFMTTLAIDPTTNSAYRYETNGSLSYKIIVGDPLKFNKKILRAENGKIVQE
ncbi:MAG: hypothetical protein NTZ35_00895 [Ignavibacteriales bacterium]|nr:hypothetical protein [Ignavibacteriales bacterium]